MQINISGSYPLGVLSVADAIQVPGQFVGSGDLDVQKAKTRKLDVHRVARTIKASTRCLLLGVTACVVMTFSVPVRALGLDTSTSVSWGTGRLDVFANSSNGQVLHKVFDNGWGPGGIAQRWEATGNLPAGRWSVAVSSVSWGQDRLDVFALGSDGHIYHKYFDNGWGPGELNADWESIGGAPLGSFTTAPTAVSSGFGRLDLFALGSDGRMYHKYFDHGWAPGGISANWESVGRAPLGHFRNPPTAVSWGVGRLDIFALGSDGSMYHKYLDNGWGPGGISANWESVGSAPPGYFISSPAAVSWGLGRLDVFALGNDGRMYHKYFDHGWGPGGISASWELIGSAPSGYFTGTPTAVSWGVGRFDIFALGNDGRIYHKYEDNGWGPGGISANWELVGSAPPGYFMSSPTAVSWGVGRLDIFALGNDGRMYHKYEDSGWGPGSINSNWESTGFVGIAF